MTKRKREAKAPQDGAMLGLDVGKARIGLAVSSSGIAVEPIEALERNGRRSTLDALERVIGQHCVRRVVVGLPLLESGEEGEQAEDTRAFARSLKRRLPALWIDFQDERWSTKDALEILGGPPADKGRLDSVAAAVILKDYLAEREEAPVTN